MLLFIVKLKQKRYPTFDYGNNIRAMAKKWEWIMLLKLKDLYLNISDHYFVKEKDLSFCNVKW